MSFSTKRCGRYLGLLTIFGLVLVLNLFDSPAVSQAARRATSGPNLTVNAAAGRQTINPNIYGITFFWSSDANTKAAQLAYANVVKLPLNRNGGDATTRYNWQVDASNAGFDWYYTTAGYPSNSVPGASMDAFIDTNRTVNSKSVMTIPTIQYITKSAGDHCSFPKSVYGDQQSYNPFVHPNGDDCGNGVNTAGQNITDTHITAHDIANTPAIQKGWVQHLLGKYGPAGSNGIIYQLDNEPHNWGYMHRDVHPGDVTEDEIISQNQAYAAAIKTADSTAWVAGPSEIQFGWYFEWVPNDPNQQNPSGPANTTQYLQAMKSYEQQHGQRLIDSFDVHYPDAGDQHYPAYMTDIDKLTTLVNQTYPGTKVSVSEWNGGNDLNGALFAADELGIYARDGVAFASFWGLDDVTAPAGYAFKMYRNYDGNGGQFGTTYVQSSSSNNGQLAVYAAQRGSDNALTVMVINKSSSDLTSPLALSGFQPASSAKVYNYNGTGGITAKPNQTVSSSGFTATYSANSITLVVIPPGTVTPTFTASAVSPFWVGATKPNTTRQNSFTVSNTGQAGSTLTVNAALSGGNASQFQVVNAADFPLSLGAGVRHPVTLSCTPTALGSLSTTLTLTTNDGGHANTAFTYTVKCSGGYVVTVPADDGSAGTLSQILGTQAVNAGDAVVFELPAGSNNQITVGANVTLSVKPGVTVDAGCNGGPTVTILGNGNTHGLTLQGGNYLNGLVIKGFNSPQLIAHGGGNLIKCTKVQG